MTPDPDDVIICDECCEPIILYGGSSMSELTIKWQQEVSRTKESLVCALSKPERDEQLAMALESAYLSGKIDQMDKQLKEAS